MKIANDMMIAFSASTDDVQLTANLQRMRLDSTHLEHLFDVMVRVALTPGLIM